MLAIKCEMCGSNQLVKQDGLFVCQHCKTKYTPEEAKRIILEGPVKIDNTDRLRNLYVLARRARDKGDVPDAARYYGMILLDDPESWEACFYDEYFQAMSAGSHDMHNALSRLSHSLQEVFRLVRKAISNPDQLENTVSEISSGVIYLGRHMKDVAKRLYDPKDSNTVRYYTDCLTALKDTFYNLGNEVARFKDLTALSAWHEGIQAQRTLRDLSSGAARRSNRDELDRYTNLIHQYDSGYNPNWAEYEPHYNPPAAADAQPTGASAGSPVWGTAHSTGKQNRGTVHFSKDVVRPRMRTGMIVCLIFAVIYFIMAFSSPGMWSAVFLFAILAGVFYVLTRTPKHVSHVVLPGLNIDIPKRRFVLLSLLIWFIITVVIT